MKTFLSILAAIVISFTSVAQTKQTAQPKQTIKTETVKFSVSMTCGKCQANVEKNIPFEKGVKDVKVDLPKKEVDVTFDPAKTSKEDIIKAFEKLKFKAKVVEPKKK